jgi:hypothetical protein
MFLIVIVNVLATITPSKYKLYRKQDSLVTPDERMCV